MLLNNIKFPADTKFLNFEALSQLCKELRKSIITVTSENGGHLGSSLGAIELTVALHYVFDTPRDRLIWDIGHQAYAHKLLTGRYNKFATLRREGGLAGFTKREESDYDAFGTGHSSTSISAALGMEAAKNLQNQKHKVIAIIGDGALSAGMAYEAINNAGHLKNNLVVILNDNKMSISPSTGALASHLRPKSLDSLTNKICKNKLKGSNQGTDPLFNSLGFDYIGPIDGHDLNGLIATLEKIKTTNTQKPILIHVLTQKGRGLIFSEVEKENCHSVSKFCIKTGVQFKNTHPSYTQIFSNTLVHEAMLDSKIVAITAAMATGTGLSQFKEKFPERFFDVGIAEQHAATFAAGLACEGMSPFVAIYSTFLQRSFDQIAHDIALQKLPVRFAIDRAGLVGEDGPTHSGAFDIAFLGILPNFTIMCPSDGNELSSMVHTASKYNEGPIAFRYPRDTLANFSRKNPPAILEIGKGRIIKEGNDIAILSLGTRLKEAIKANQILQKQHNLSITIADARFAKPIDEALITQLIQNHKALITIEDGSIGGFSAHVNNFILKNNLNMNRYIKNLFLPDRFIPHGNTTSLYNKHTDLNHHSILEIIKQILNLSNIIPLNTNILSPKYVHGKISLPNGFQEPNLILNGEGPERTHKYVENRVHDKIKKGFLKDDGYFNADVAQG